MSLIKDIKKAYFNGVFLPNPKVLGEKVSEIIKALNLHIQGIFSTLTISGTITQSLTTDSTNKDTGAIITEGGIGIEKSLSVGTNINLEKEVNHIIAVTDSSTTNTAGGGLTINTGDGVGSGAGGELNITLGNGGTTGNGGRLIFKTGDGGSSSGSSGIVDFRTGDTSSSTSGSITLVTGTPQTNSSGNIIIRTGGPAVSGQSGDVQISTGTTTSGIAGTISLDPGTGTSTTVAGKILLSDGILYTPKTTTVASGGTITGVQLVNSLINATGATGNWQLPSASDIRTALGSAPAGCYFDFVFNATPMTAANIATLVVGSNMTVQSSPAITGGGDLTINQSTQGIAVFRIIFTVANTDCKIIRIS